MNYNDLISSYILKNGGDNKLVTVILDYLEHAHPHDEPPWNATLTTSRKPPSFTPITKSGGTQKPTPSWLVRQLAR